MKIAYVAIAYISQRDGVSVYIENLLLNLLAEIAQACRHDKVEVHVYGCKGALQGLASAVTNWLCMPKAEERVVPEVMFIQCPYDGLTRFIWTSYNLRAHGPYLSVIMPNMQPLPLVPRPRLSVLHDLTFKRCPRYLSPKLRLYSNMLIRVRLFRDDAIAYVSESTRRDLERFFRIGSNKSLISLPNGLPRKLANARRPGRTRLHDKICGDELSLVFVSRINRLKGFDRVLEVCRATDMRFDELQVRRVTLHVIGKQTPEANALLSNQIYHHVELKTHGYVDDDVLNSLYERSTFCLFLSRNEGFGLPCIEAIWFRCVPILSDIPIFREVMGLDFPLFYGVVSDANAVVDFMIRLRRDAAFRDKTIAAMERSLERHRSGYEIAAKELLKWIDHARTLRYRNWQPGRLRIRR